MSTTDTLSVVLCFKKKFFPSEYAATTFTKRLNEKYGMDILRSYYCKVCMGFHLTKKPLWTFEPQPAPPSDDEWQLTRWEGPADFDMTGQIFLDHHEVLGYCDHPGKTGWVCHCQVCGNRFRLSGVLVRKILKGRIKYMGAYICNHTGGRTIGSG